MLESPLDCKEIKPVNPNGNLPWIFPGRAAAEAETPNTLTSWWKEPTHWKRPWCWERQRVEGEGDDRGWDGWMASPTQWTWVWANSRRWWRTGKSVGSHRVGHDLVTEQQQTAFRSHGRAEELLRRKEVHKHICFAKAVPSNYKNLPLSSMVALPLCLKWWFDGTNPMVAFRKIIGLG